MAGITGGRVAPATIPDCTEAEVRERQLASNYVGTLRLTARDTTRSLTSGGLCARRFLVGQGLTDEVVRTTLRRPVHAAADIKRCCGDRLFGPISRAKSARHSPLPPL